MWNKTRLSTILVRGIIKYSKAASPVIPKKPTAPGNSSQKFLDLKEFRAIGGKGGDGCVSFLSLWCNENAGPDGGDGGNGGHVILQASSHVSSLNKVPTVAKADEGEKGLNNDCIGRNASHLVIKVPVGTVIRDQNGTVVGDLCKEGLMFLAARGGAGGKGNHFFISDTQQAPKVGEYGALGEHLAYTVELKSMAHVGLIGFPNAGKSTLLRAVSRARPKVAPYPFTTLQPHLGMVQYNDYEQISIADLPGLIPGSHKNKGLGIQFLKHVERCMALVYVIDASVDEPWKHLETLQFELSQFNPNFKDRAQLVVANKIDLPEALDNIESIKSKTDLLVVPVSGKTSLNVFQLLREIKTIYDKQNTQAEPDNR